MFQYTREIIINTADKYSAESGVLSVDHVGNYVSERIEKAILVPHVAESKGKAVFAIPAKQTKINRIFVEVRLEGDVEASYGNAAWARMQKPFVFEWSNKTPAEVQVELDRVLSISDHPFLKATISGSNLTLTCTDCYQRFHTAVVDEFVARTPNLSQFETEGTWTNVSKATVTQGKQGLGTYAQMIKNHRLPTIENTQWLAINKEEYPVPNTNYDMYEIKYNSGRRNIGGSGVVGQLDSSITTHRFYVATGISAGFKTAIQTATGKTFTDGVLVTPPATGAA